MPVQPRAESFQAAITELERMTTLIGATWDGELDTRAPGTWLGYLWEKAERAANAATTIVQIASGESNSPQTASPLLERGFIADLPTREAAIGHGTGDGDGLRELAVPFARRAAVAGEPGLLCPFCGTDELLVSTRDREEDSGRVQMYCSSPECDAREFEIIVRRDGQPEKRADIDALDRLAAAGGDPAARVDP